MAARRARVARLTSRLDALGWDGGLDAELREGTPRDAWAARVVRVDGESSLVDRGRGEERAIARPLPVVGDWVAVEDGDAVLRIVSRLPRRSELVRADSRRRQVLASNVDVVFVVVPLDRPDPLFEVERGLAVAFATDAEVVVLLTKADTHSAPQEVVGELASRAPGVDAHVVSVRTGLGVADTAARLRPNRTGVLLGASGAGKSTLTNLLVGDDVMSTAATRPDGEGRHTTTARRLSVLPGGGVLIDIPGVRTFGLAAAEGGIDRLYADLVRTAATCRFADCSHEGEPGCAVEELAASDAGVRRRVRTWLRLRHEADAFTQRPR